jgi:hypothetical protein
MLRNQKQITDYNEYTNNISASYGADMFSQPQMVAEVIYEAVTDGTDKLRYIAGADAKQLIDINFILTGSRKKNIF